MSIKLEDFSSMVRDLQNCDNRLAIDASHPTDACGIIQQLKEVLMSLLETVTQQVQGSPRLRVTSENLHTIPLDKRYVFPPIGYCGLHETLTNIMCKLHKLQNEAIEMTEAVLECLCYTSVFVEENMRVILPLQIAGVLSQLNQTALHDLIKGHIMKALCKTIIPVCFGVVTDESRKSLGNISGIVMLVLEYVSDVSFHFQLMETLMTCKENLWSDIMMVISYSDGLARVYATQILFHYWPHLHSTLRNEHKLASNCIHSSFSCENPNCKSVSNTSTATTMILDVAFPTKMAKKPAPLYLCQTCTQLQLNMEPSTHMEFADVILPTKCIKHQCENKHCLSTNSLASVTVFGSHARSGLNDFKLSTQVQKHNLLWHCDRQIMRYCEECYNNLEHLFKDLNLVVQLAPSSAWDQRNFHLSRVMVNAIVCLLSEEVDFYPKITSNGTAKSAAYENKESFSFASENSWAEVFGVYSCGGCIENMGSQTAPLTLRHFGVWLLVSLCPPQPNIDQELVCQLVAAVLVWYKNSSLLSSDDFGTRLENLKPMYLKAWLKEMCDLYFKQFVMCLLPNPPTQARVAGHWDSIRPLWWHYKEGINLLICLASYSVISLELWECVIPCWMIALCENLTSEELKKLKYPLNALFDKDPSLSFPSEDTFAFICHSFAQPQLIDQENALEWLLVLCEVDVYIPFDYLLPMLSELQSSLFSRFSSCEETEKGNHAKERQHRFPHLSDKDFKKFLARSSQPGLMSLDDIMNGLNMPCTGHDKECDFRPVRSVTPNENKKSLRRVGSTRQAKAKVSALFKAKRSIHRRRESSVPEAVEMETLRAPSNASLPEPHVCVANKLPRNVRKLSSEWNKSRIVACYVDILDIIYNQFIIQDRPQHGGLKDGDSAHISRIILCLFSHVIEDNEKNQQDPTNKKDCPECVQAELQLTGEFFGGAAKLFSILLPKEPKSQYGSEFGTKLIELSVVDERKAKTTLKMEDFDVYEISVKLLYRLVKFLEHHAHDQTVTTEIINCMSFLCLHGNLCHDLSKINESIMEEFISNMFLPSLWKQLSVYHSDTSKQLVAILLEAINVLDRAFEGLLALIDDAFLQGFNIAEEYAAAKCEKAKQKETEKARNEMKCRAEGKTLDDQGDKKEKVEEEPIENWSLQFETLDRIQAFLIFIKDGHPILEKRSSITHVIAYMFSVVLASLRLPNSAVYAKAKFIIDSLSHETLQISYLCLQHEFDKSLRDRTFVTSQLLLVHQMRPHSSPLSFTRFSHFMDVLAKESILRKRLGLSFAFPPNACSQKDHLRAEQNQAEDLLTNQRSATLITFSQKLEGANLLIGIDDDFVKKCQLGAGESYMSALNSLYEFNFTSQATGGFCPAQMKEETQMNKETVNHLMLVICKYMIGCEEEIKEKSTTKEFHAFLRQLQTWLSYNEQIGYFTNIPSVLRSTVGVSTLLKNLPMILDCNHTLGNIFLPIALALLELVVKTSDVNCGQTSPSDCRDFDLDVLVETDQLAWLKTLQVIMYKYAVKECIQVEQLTRLLYICLKTLRQQFHICNSKMVGMLSDKDQRNEVKNSSNALAKKRSDKHLSLDVDKYGIRGSASFCKERGADEDTFPLLGNLTAASSRQDIISIGTYNSHDKSTERVDHSSSMENIFLSGETMFKNGNDAAVSRNSSSKLRSGDTIGKQTDCNSNELLSSRCSHCKEVIKDFGYETLSLCIANLCQFVKFNPALAVPLLPKLLSQMAYIAEPLRDERSNDSAMSSVVLTAKQSIRCIVHQLADHRIFRCLFLISFPPENLFFPVLIACLRGYSAFNCVRVLKHTLEDLPDDLDTLHRGDLNCLLTNLASYLFHLRNDPSSNSQWQTVFNSFSSLFVRLNTHITKQGTYSVSVDPVLRVMIHLLKSPVLTNTKLILLEPFSKFLSTSVTKCNFSVNILYHLCVVNSCTFNKDRDKMHLARCVISKLVSALKMNTEMLHHNLILLLQIVLMDSGSTVNSSTTSMSDRHIPDVSKMNRSCAMECMKCYIGDCLDLLGDENFLKNLDKDDTSTGRRTGGSIMLKVSRGSDLKLAIAQVVAGGLCTLSSNSAQLQSLLQPPPAMQHGLKGYSECVTQITKLSWVLLGSLSHLGLQQGACENLWYPIPFNEGCNLATNVQVILTGYLEQKKDSKMTMSSLFHAFIFCQLWTVYYEQLSYFTTSSSSSSQGGSSGSISFTSYNPVGDHHGADMQLFEFWSKVTPCVLVLMEHDEMVAENIRRHIASLIECLQRYNSSTLVKLYPIWSPMLGTCHSKDAMATQDISQWPDTPLTVMEKSSSLPADQSDQPQREMTGVVDSAAVTNAQHVLRIVESINGKLVQMERHEAFLIV